MSIAANFSWVKVSESPCVIRYTDTSSPTPGCWLWDFPSGTIISGGTETEQGPHDVQYDVSGAHDATLWVGEASTNCCPDQCDCEFTVDFTANRQGGAGCVYNFTPNKTVISGELIDCKYGWDFGDGVTSNLESPSHEFFSCSSFDVKLFVNCGCCSAQKVKTIDCGNCIDFGPVIEDINIGHNSDNDFCSVCFAAQISVGCPIAEWEWKIDGVIESTFSEFCKAYLHSEDGDAHSIELKVTDSSGCVATMVAPFTVDCNIVGCGGCAFPNDIPQAFPVAIISGINAECFGDELNKAHVLTKNNTWCNAYKTWSAYFEGLLFDFTVISAVDLTQGPGSPAEASIQVVVTLHGSPIPINPPFQNSWKSLGGTCVGTHVCHDVIPLGSKSNCGFNQNALYPDAILDVP